jgi:[ribosomal protein S5]-alanine N-acetyltransferase
LNHAATVAASARLAFEPLAPAHAAELAGWLGDSRLWRWIPHPAPAPAEVARRFAVISDPERPNGERWLNFVVRRRLDEQAVGLVETTVHPAGRAHLAYFVFVPFQRQGYALEACASVLAHLRDGCGVTHVEALVDTRNEPSQRLLATLHFTRDDAMLPADPIDGAPAHDYRYRLALRGRVT